MKLPFVKMEGAGNDYVYVDGFRVELPADQFPTLASWVSDRHFGIGSDGLIVLLPSAVADCRMAMWNADGSRGAMCGNGLRCLAQLAYDAGHVSRRQIRIETDSGVREATILDDGHVRVDMGEVTVDSTPATVHLAGGDWTYRAGDAGNPHAVIFTDDDLARVSVGRVGAAF